MFFIYIFISGDCLVQHAERERAAGGWGGGRRNQTRPRSPGLAVSSPYKQASITALDSRNKRELFGSQL